MSIFLELWKNYQPVSSALKLPTRVVNKLIPSLVKFTSKENDYNAESCQN